MVQLTIVVPVYWSSIVVDRYLCNQQLKIMPAMSSHFCAWDAQSPGAWLGYLPEMSRAWSQGVGQVGFSSGGSGEKSTPKQHSLVFRIQSRVVWGQRPLFSCWLAVRGCSQHVQVAHTAPISSHALSSDSDLKRSYVKVRPVLIISLPSGQLIGDLNHIHKIPFAIERNIITGRFLNFQWEEIRQEPGSLEVIQMSAYHNQHVGKPFYSFKEFHEFPGSFIGHARWAQAKFS